ncbi:hypothetical protein D770_23285 [Flammeovirgaceae bacterium 311]|nr:hypothetical protein D770_23285 [Flammeovirgaceae bacterium 311]
MIKLVRLFSSTKSANVSGTEIDRYLMSHAAAITPVWLLFIILFRSHSAQIYLSNLSVCLRELQAWLKPAGFTLTEASFHNQ